MSSLLLNIPAVAVTLGALYTRTRRRLRQVAADDEDSSRRLARRPHRRPWTQPASTYGQPLPANLAKAMRCFGRVPIEHYRHRRRVVALWRLVKLNLLPTKTTPKSAFTTTDWHYEPSDSTNLGAGHPYCGGFVFRLRLHCNENRWHLQRSLRIGRSQSRVQRLIVIASVRNLFDPDSWVRCLEAARVGDHPPVVGLSRVDFRVPQQRRPGGGFCHYARAGPGGDGCDVGGGGAAAAG